MLQGLGLVHLARPMASNQARQMVPEQRGPGSGGLHGSHPIPHLHHLS